MNWQLIAKIKILKDRAANWAVLFNFLMIAALFVDKFENILIGIIILVLIIISIMALAVVDYIFILPKEQEVLWQKNPEWMKR